MDKEQGQIWYQRALYYDSLQDKANAEKSLAFARKYDPMFALPKHRKRTLLKVLEYASLLAAIMFAAWIIFLLLHKTPTSQKVDFPWWSVSLHSTGVKHVTAAGVSMSGVRSDSISQKRVSMRRVSSNGVSQNGVGSSSFSPDGVSTGDGNPGGSSLLLAESEPIRVPTSEEDTGNAALVKESTYSISATLPHMLLRSALYYYAGDQGKFPKNLQELIAKKYLDRIPEEPTSELNQVSPTFTDRGGWVYHPPTVFAADKLCAQIETALYANKGGLPHYSFAPLSLRVSLGEPSITLLAGDFPLKNWPVAAGAVETPTPMGDFRVIEKEVLDSNTVTPYGTRWLRLGQSYTSRGADGLARRGIGIHGTDSNTAIGLAVTSGCIRMHNSDVEELFQLIPNGTRIRIEL